jgi:hypothetical protein
MNLSAAIANSLWTASNVPALIQFRRALNRPTETQMQLLRGYLTRNADTAYGNAHGFGKIKNYEEFSRKVPLADYDDIEPWIARIMRGENRVLTSEPVTRLIPTSGSSGARKLIPFTAGCSLVKPAGHNALKEPIWIKCLKQVCVRWFPYSVFNSRKSSVREMRNFPRSARHAFSFPRWTSR